VRDDEEPVSTPTALMTDARPASSLVVIGRLDSRSLGGGEFFYQSVFGHIDDLGFCRGLDQALSHRPPRPERIPYDDWCRDRFLFFKADDRSRSIGRLEVDEAFVYDNRMRSEIDFTGFRVTISLQTDAYQAYLDYIGDVRVPATLSDPDTWDGRILIRIPSRPFAFPMPRGNSDPWNIQKPVVGRLKPIRRFAFDEIEIQALRDEHGRPVRLDDPVGEQRSGWQPALALRAQRRTIARSLINLLRRGRA
jgi:hypothetical protein